MIEVRIPTTKLDAFGNEVHANMHVLAALREAGVPATGVLGLRGVENGVLEIECDDLAADEIVYRWRA